MCQNPEGVILDKLELGVNLMIEPKESFVFELVR